jgi:hypothetical protein
MGRAGNAGLDGAGELDIFEGNWSVYKDLIFQIRKSCKKGAKRSIKWLCTGSSQFSEETRASSCLAYGDFYALVWRRVTDGRRVTDCRR